MNSDGSAYAEQAKWMDSLEAKTQQLKAAWQELSVTIMNSDFLKGLVDAGTIALTVLNDIINTIGLLNTAFLAIGIYSFIKNFD